MTRRSRAFAALFAMIAAPFAIMCLGAWLTGQSVERLGLRLGGAEAEEAQPLVPAPVKAPHVRVRGEWEI